MLVLVEGNIGAGKSTFCSELRIALQQDYENVFLLSEPVSNWQDFGGGTNLLELFYQDKSRWGLAFQTNVLIDMERQFAQAVKLSSTIPESVVILDRSLLSCGIFMRILHSHMKSFEAQILKKLFDRFVEGFLKVPFVMIKLDTDPAKCLERIRIRSRHEETGAVTLEYLELLKAAHRKEITRYSDIFSKMKLLSIRGDAIPIAFRNDDTVWERVIIDVKKKIQQVRNNQPSSPSTSSATRGTEQQDRNYQPSSPSTPSPTRGTERYQADGSETVFVNK